LISFNRWEFDAADYPGDSGDAVGKTGRCGEERNDDGPVESDAVVVNMAQRRGRDSGPLDRVVQAGPTGVHERHSVSGWVASGGAVGGWDLLITAINGGKRSAVEHRG
jgi:hypothetical protein